MMVDTKLVQQLRTDRASEVMLILGDRQAARALLAAWLRNDDPDDIAEQQATFEELKQALDQDRLSSRKLFS